MTTRYKVGSIVNERMPSGRVRRCRVTEVVWRNGQLWKVSMDVLPRKRRTRSVKP